MAKPAGWYKICDVNLNAKEHWSEWWTFYRSLTSSVHPSEKPWPVVLRGGGYNLVRGQHINLVAIWNALRCTNSFTFLCGPLVIWNILMINAPWHTRSSSGGGGLENWNQLGMFVVQSWESQMALSCSRLKSQTSFRSDTTGLVNFPEGNEEIVDTNMCSASIVTTT